jgi:hypothetical protein
MPWDYQINVVTVVDMSEDQVIKELETTRLIDDIAENPEEIIIKLKQVIALGVCGKIELTMEEIEERGKIQPVFDPMPLESLQMERMSINNVPATTIEVGNELDKSKSSPDTDKKEKKDQKDKNEERTKK